MLELKLLGLATALRPKHATRAFVTHKGGPLQIQFLNLKELATIEVPCPEGIAPFEEQRVYFAKPSEGLSWFTLASRIWELGETKHRTVINTYEVATLEEAKACFLAEFGVDPTSFTECK